MANGSSAISFRNATTASSAPSWEASASVSDWNFSRESCTAKRSTIPQNANGTYGEGRVNVRVRVRVTVRVAAYPLLLLRIQDDVHVDNCWFLHEWVRSQLRGQLLQDGLIGLILSVRRPKKRAVGAKSSEVKRVQQGTERMQRAWHGGRQAYRVRVDRSGESPVRVTTFDDSRTRGHASGE